MERESVIGSIVFRNSFLSTIQTDKAKLTKGEMMMIKLVLKSDSEKKPKKSVSGNIHIKWPNILGVKTDISLLRKKDIVVQF